MADESVEQDKGGEIRDFWASAGWLWSVIFGITLFTSLLVTLIDDEHTVTQRLTAVGLTAFLGLWFLGYFYLILRAMRLMDGQLDPRESWLGLIYLFAALPAWFVLTRIDPIYNIVLFGLYPQIFSYVHLRWAIPISLVLSSLVAYLQVEGSDAAFLSLSNPWLWYFIFSSAVGIGLAFFISGIIDQSAKRRDLIEELKETQAALANSKKREGVLAERERLARDIHDTVAQGFISIITHLEASEENWEIDLAQSKHHIQQAQKMARQGVNQARRVVQDLRPDVLENRSLFDGIEQVTADWSQQSGIEAKAVLTGQPLNLSTSQETVLVRVVQEGLANVQKHAEASTVQITLSYMDNLVMLDVQDDGIGFSSESKSPHAQNGGFGLRAMAQRVTQAGGSLELESDPGEGTTVVVRLPVA